MPKVIKKEEPVLTDEISRDFKAFVTLKREIETLTKAQNEIKARLVDVVERYGEADDKGHVWFNLADQIDGYVAMQRQRRVSQKLDEAVAEALLTSKDLFDRCYSMQPVLQEDEVMACLYEGLLTEEEIDEMFPKTITWAFVPSKG